MKDEPNPIALKTSSSILIALFFSFFFFFSTFAPLGQVVSDTAYSVETAKSLFYRHTFSIEKTWELRFATLGRDGRYFSKFGLGYALSFLPHIAMSSLLSNFFHIDKKYIEQAIISFTNTFYAACIAVALFVLFSALGYRKRQSLITVALISAASILLPYSKIIQSETMTTFFIILFLIMVAYDQQLMPKSGFTLGMICSVLYFIKPANLVVGLVIVIYVIVRFWGKRATVSGLTAFFSAAILPGIVLLYFNWYRFGSIVAFGYGDQQYLFSTPIVHGLAGFLNSPSKSIFLFSPLALFCLLGFNRFFSKHRSVAFCIAAIGILFLFLYARWFDWKGGWSWGPRLIVPGIIILHIVLIEFVDRKKFKKIFLIPFVAIILFSVSIQFLGSMVSYQQVHYFYSFMDPFSVKNSQIEVAARLFLHKAQGKPEQYPCEMFHLQCDSLPYERDGKLFGGRVLSFEDKESFQGFATFWSGLSHNFGWRLCGYVPLLLFLISFLSGWSVYRKLTPEVKKNTF
jgi:hypothetical protein